jgi:hypothetical protein
MLMYEPFCLVVSEIAHMRGWTCLVWGGSGRGIFQGSIPAFAWRDRVTTKIISHNSQYPDLDMNRVPTNVTDCDADCPDI